MPALAESIPLTYEQDRYLARLEASGWAHKNVQLSYEILGALDAEALLAAVRAFVTRHDALHLQIAADGHGAARQHRQPLRPGEEPIEFVQVRAASVEQFNRYAAVLLSRDRLTPWRYGHERPYAIRLLRHDEHRHALLATFQNLVFDGRAHHLFGHEIWRDYELLRRGEPVPVQAPSFVAAAHRQRSRTTAQRRERARESWRERLAFLARHQLFETGDTGRVVGGSVAATIEAAAAATFRRWCAHHRATVLQELVGAFAGALAARTGHRELGLWISMDTRTALDRDVVGMFAGTCPIVLADATADAAVVRSALRVQLARALTSQCLTAAEIAELTAQAGTARPVPREIYVNLRRFEGDHRPATASGALTLTPDAYPLRRISFQETNALHLRCTEFRDRIFLELIYDGIRADHALARTVLDDMIAIPHRLTENGKPCPTS
ncbi:condensation domain-containing protein [Actinoplanes sp. N902-109]|uniref:condensation domain-containing protein n=1 Tax=Actinoplanes sp. (strain N902-109) TaxID=649831 RepID=UPI0003294345|nr:condensation domain-containing protein [Actinoplanes sp. N902-109]AGL19155.1 peptide synthetase [Actinoplanes sp. N902-109]